MRKLIFSFILFILPAFASVKISLKVPFSYNLLIPADTEQYKVWNGIFTGGLIAPEFQLKKLGLEPYIGLTYNWYFPYSGQFPENITINYFNLRYGANVKFYIKNIFLGAGFGVLYTMYGTYGTSTARQKMSNDYLGNDFFFTLLGGYEYKLSDKFSLPLEFNLHIDPFLIKSILLEMQLSVGISMKIR